MAVNFGKAVEQEAAGAVAAASSPSSSTATTGRLLFAQLGYGVGRLMECMFTYGTLNA